MSTLCKYACICVMILASFLLVTPANSQTVSEIDSVEKREIVPSATEQVNEKKDIDSEVEKEFQPSFREDVDSLFYSPNQISLLKSALLRIEPIMSLGAISPQNIVTDEDEEQLEKVPDIIPDLFFPTFHVASIAYHSPRDWMLWINGQRVTNKRKYDGLDIIKVSSGVVQLRWKPDNWQYRQTVWKSSDKLTKDLLKLHAQEGRTFLDNKTESLVATLRSNQTLVTVTPTILEGKHSEYAVTVKPNPSSPTEEGESSVESMQASIEKIMNEATNKAKEAKEAAREKSQIILKNPALPVSDKAQVSDAAPVQPALPALAPASNTLNDILNAVTSAGANPTP